jgi:septum formation protein
MHRPLTHPTASLRPPLTHPMTQSSLILASTSKYRRELIARLKIDFETLRPLVDEDSLKAQWSSEKLSPQELAEHLSQAKAESLIEQRPASWIVGSDQLVDLEGEILGKAPDFESACAQLQKLSGRTHRLITALALAKKGEKTEIFTDITTLRFRVLTREEIENYVRIEEPYDCAGTYKIEGLGIRLLESLETKDPTAIVGLPLITLSKQLQARGYSLA